MQVQRNDDEGEHQRELHVQSEVVGGYEEVGEGREALGGLMPAIGRQAVGAVEGCRRLTVGGAETDHESAKEQRAVRDALQPV